MQATSAALDEMTVGLRDHAKHEMRQKSESMIANKLSVRKKGSTVAFDYRFHGNIISIYRLEFVDPFEKSYNILQSAYETSLFNATFAMLHFNCFVFSVTAKRCIFEILP